MRLRARCIALAGLLLPGLLAAAPEPPASSVDHVYALTGTWTCRTLRGAETRHVGTRTGDMLDVVNDVRPATGRPYTLDDRYIFDPAGGMWHIVLGAGTPIAIEAVAPPWTGATWELHGRAAGGFSERVTFELIGESVLRRKIEAASSGGTWLLTSAELCNRGEDAPPRNACISSDSPAFVVALAALDRRTLPLQTPYGTVEIHVELDDHSRIVSTKTVRTPSPYLSGMVVQALRVSTLQTAVRDCRPVASGYDFTIRFLDRFRHVIE
jgi:hypothetical protein